MRRTVCPAQPGASCQTSARPRRGLARRRCRSWALPPGARAARRRCLTPWRSRSNTH